MTLRFTKGAVADVEAAYRFVALNNAGAADALVSKIDQAIAGLLDHPERGRVGRVPGTRELIVSNSPYVVAYTVTPDAIQILAVIHGARAWPSSF